MSTTPLGLNVIVVDGDMGLANIDLLFNLDPQFNLNRVVQGEKRLEEIIVTGPYGLQIIPGASAIIKVIWQQAGPHNFKLVVNQARSRDAADSAPLQLRSVARRFLKLEIEDIGFLPADENVSCSVRNPEPLVLAHPAPPPPAPSTNAAPPSKKPMKPIIHGEDQFRTPGGSRSQADGDAGSPTDQASTPTATAPVDGVGENIDLRG